MWVVKLIGGVPSCNGTYVKLYQSGEVAPRKLTLTVWLTEDKEEAHAEETYQAPSQH